MLYSVLAFTLGMLLGYWAKGHEAELVNLEEREYLAAVEQICIGHGKDAVMRERLLQELKTYRHDVYIGRETLSSELQLMLERAGV